MHPNSNSEYMSDIIELQYYIPQMFMYLASFVLSTFIYPDLIDGWLNNFPSLSEDKKEDQKNDVELGKFIGIFERLIILLSMYLNQFTLIPMLLTAKSIIRFPEANKDGKNFAEYFLIGTLTSFTFAILTGAIVLAYLTLLEKNLFSFAD